MHFYGGAKLQYNVEQLVCIYFLNDKWVNGFTGKSYFYQYFWYLSVTGFLLVLPVQILKLNHDRLTMSETYLRVSSKYFSIFKIWFFALLMAKYSKSVKAIYNHFSESSDLVS